GALPRLSRTAAVEALRAGDPGALPRPGAAGSAAARTMGERLRRAAPAPGRRRRRALRAIQRRPPALPAARCPRRPVRSASRRPLGVRARLRLRLRDRLQTEGVGPGGGLPKSPGLAQRTRLRAGAPA